MDQVDIRLECENNTKYSKLINTRNIIICPECFEHDVNIEETFKIPLNKEKILRKEIELFFERIQVNDLNQAIEKHFDEITFQIDFHTERLIEKINEYRIELIEKVKLKRKEIVYEVDKFEIKNPNKSLFFEELEKTKSLFEKLKIEEAFKKKIKDIENIEKEIMIKMREYKFLQVDKMEDIKDFVGILNMPENFFIDYQSGESKAENIVKNERKIEEKKANADVEQKEDKPPAAPYRPRAMGGTGFAKTFRHLYKASDKGSWRIKPEESSSSNDCGIVPEEHESTNFWRREPQDKKILDPYRKGRGPRNISKEARSKYENIDEDLWRSSPPS